MKNKIPERRKNYYIKKKFQRNFILKFFTLIVLGALIFGAVIYLMSRSALTTTFENSRLAVRSSSDYMLPYIVMSGTAAIVIIGFAAIVMTLFASHKIAGPLYRIGKNIEDLASGNLNVRFGLRSGDEIKELAEKLDAMAQSLRSKVAAIKSAFRSLEASAKDASPEMKRDIQNLKEAISRLDV